MLTIEQNCQTTRRLLPEMFRISDVIVTFHGQMIIQVGCDYKQMANYSGKHL